MSVASRLLTALLGLGLIWFFWPFGGGSDEVVTAVSPPPTAADARLFTKPANPAPKTKRPTPQSATEDKTGDTMTAALPTEAPAAPKVLLKPKRFYRVVVRDGGTLEAGDVVITLAGIKPRAADAICKDAKGRRWTCGAQARFALMRLIRGRAVSCKVPVKGSGKALSARCTLAGTDLSTWMVTHGWAEPAVDAEPKLAAAADKARQKKIGIWR